MDRDLAVAMGQAARQARDALGLTQEKVAEQIGVSVEFYSRIERGRAHPSLETFLRMTSVLGVSADTLLGLDDSSRVVPVAVSLMRPDDPPALRHLVPALRQARRGTVRLVGKLLNALAEPRASGKRDNREERAGDD